MPFRARLKKTFGRSSSPGGSSGDSSSADSKSKSGVYLPGEKIPQSKYRRPVAKEHKEKLEAFSFAHAWRRQSHTSTYSPMGSRMPSRKNSAEPQVGRRSRSFVQQVAEGDVDDTDLANGERLINLEYAESVPNKAQLAFLDNIRQTTDRFPPRSRNTGAFPLFPKTLRAQTQNRQG